MTQHGGQDVLPMGFVARHATPDLGRVPLGIVVTLAEAACWCVIAFLLVSATASMAEAQELASSFDQLSVGTDYADSGSPAAISFCSCARFALMAA